METNKPSESGQVLVLLVLGIVALLGFVALAIDGGMVYSDRRFSQNAADASSLAGGGEAALIIENMHMDYGSWDCDAIEVHALPDAKDAAIAQAANNDFTIDADVTDHHGVDTVCVDEGDGLFAEKYIDVITHITFETDTSFLHFIYNGPLINQVEAVTRVRPETELAFGDAVVAHRGNCPNSNTGGVHFNGSSEVTINGSGVFSSACMRAGGSLGVGVDGGDILYTTDYQESGNPDIDPDPSPTGTNQAMPDYVFTVDPPPDCSIDDDDTDGEIFLDYGEHTGSGSLSPGVYSRIRLQNGELNLSPGLYCLNGNFTVNGGDLNVTGNEEDGVTIYMISGDFDTSGNATVHLRAPQTPNPPHRAITGLLIYMAEGNDGEVSLLGTEDSYYIGSVYAADDDAMIEIGGTGSLLKSYNVQLVAGTVFIHGNAEIDIQYEGMIPFKPPTQLELYK